MLSFGDTITDSQKQEQNHGTTEFPIACYYDDLKDKSIPWHWHEEVEAGIITHGSMVIHTPSVQHTLTKGQGFFINSGVLHKMEMEMNYYYLTF